MSEKLENLGFMTKAIHSGEVFDDQFGALSTPIYQTSTFCFDNTQEGIDTFAGKKAGYAYSRSKNPTVNVLEAKVSELEGGAGAIACASGMGAISSVMWSLLESGDHVIVGDCVYGCTDLLISQRLPKFGIEVSSVDTSNLEAVKAAIKPNTKIVYFETPTNPMMKVTDIAAVKEIVGEGVYVVVDNTFAPPPIQKPLDCGADIVVHSVTKYLNGHGDVIGGIIVAKDEDLLQLFRGIGMSKLTGATCSPFEAFLVIRGLQTLGLRVKRHCENAQKIAEYLLTKKEVSKVYYPGLSDFEGHDIVEKQMNGLGTGILSFELEDNINGKTSFEAAKALMDSMKLAHIAVSLGDPASLIQYPYRMTHNVVPEDVKIASGVTPQLMRFSAGLEDADDLIADFENAFAQI